MVYILFLTDGLATAGEMKEGRIADNATQATKFHARVFSFGIGYDANSLLLDKLSRACLGQSQYVRSDEDNEASVSRLYACIEAPVRISVGETIDEIDLHRQNQELVDGMIALSTKHGIITPYTSFLADDSPASLSIVRPAVGRDVPHTLGRLSEASGRIVFESRKSQEFYRAAMRARDSGIGGLCSTRERRSNRHR